MRHFPVVGDVVGAVIKILEVQEVLEALILCERHANGLRFQNITTTTHKELCIELIESVAQSSEMVLKGLQRMVRLPDMLEGLEVDLAAYHSFVILHACFPLP
jgi:hypothetical protein